MARPVGNNGNEELFDGGLQYGGNGEDSIWGAEGQDILYGENGRDTLIGGEDWHYNEDFPEVYLADELYGNNGNDTLIAGPDVWVNEYTQYDEYNFINSRDVVILGDKLDGGRGDDVLHGSYGGDTLIGGNGNDELHSGGFYDYSYVESYYYGEDNEYYYYWSDTVKTATADVLDGGKGDDVLYVDGIWSYGDEEGGVYAILTGGQGYDEFNFTNLGWNDGDSDFSDIVEITDFSTAMDSLVFSSLLGSGTDPDNYVENLTDAGSLAQIGADASAALAGGANYYFGVYDGDGYLVASDDIWGWGTVIQLTGVTDIDVTDILSA